MVALEHAWSTIRARHHELPLAVVIVGSGSVARSHGLRLGHFAASRWHDRGAGELSEIFIAGEGLHRGATDVLGTLLHEGAHALAHARAIKDTSRQGRYHNIRFKRLAEELGLELERDLQLGWSLAWVPEATHTPYAKNIAALARAMTMHRPREFPLPVPEWDRSSLRVRPSDPGRAWRSRSGRDQLRRLPNPVSRPVTTY